MQKFEKRLSSQAFECVKFRIRCDPLFRIDELPINFSYHIVYKILNFDKYLFCKDCLIYIFCDTDLLNLDFYNCIYFNKLYRKKIKTIYSQLNNIKPHVQKKYTVHNILRQSKYIFGVISNSFLKMVIL